MTRTHIVQEGDSLQSVAARYGFANSKTLYDYAGNADLARKRPNPDLLFPGDRILLPPVQVKACECVEKLVHRFETKRSWLRLRIRLLNEEGKPIQNESFRIVTSDVTVSRATGSDGVLDALVPPHSDTARLEVLGMTVALQLGRLHPMWQTPDGGWSGVVARLQNLGYLPEDGLSGDDTCVEEAIRLFQREHGQPEDGRISPRLLTALERAYGC
jgi:N-acetylmuramoyl-L-alanine amidase